MEQGCRTPAALEWVLLCMFGLRWRPIGRETSAARAARLTVLAVVV